MLKVLWIGKEPMTKAQEEDLAKRLGPLEIVHEQIDWLASSKTGCDKAGNAKIWQVLFENCDVLCGVFPPEALEAKTSLVLSPVSIKNPRWVFNPRSKQPEPWIHLRWAKI